MSTNICRFTWQIALLIYDHLSIQDIMEGKLSKIILRCNETTYLISTGVECPPNPEIEFGSHISYTAEEVNSPNFSGIDLEPQEGAMYPVIELTLLFCGKAFDGTPIEVYPNGKYFVILDCGDGQFKRNGRDLEGPTGCEITGTITKEYWRSTAGTTPRSLKLWYAGIKEESDDDVEVPFLDFTYGGVEIPLNIILGEGDAAEIPPLFPTDTPAVSIHALTCPKPGANVIFAWEFINETRFSKSFKSYLGLDPDLEDVERMPGSAINSLEFLPPGDRPISLPASGSELVVPALSVQTVLLHLRLSPNFPSDQTLINLINFSILDDLGNPCGWGEGAFPSEPVFAWDPNKKIVAPQHNVQPGDLLKYTIYFENIGAGSAKEVIVFDKLDVEYLDMESFIDLGVFRGNSPNALLLSEEPSPAPHYFYKRYTKHPHFGDEIEEEDSEKGHIIKWFTTRDLAIPESGPQPWLYFKQNMIGRIEFYIRAHKALPCDQKVENTADIIFTNLDPIQAMPVIRTAPAIFESKCCKRKPDSEKKFPWGWFLIGLILGGLIIGVCWYFFKEEPQAMPEVEEAMLWFERRMQTFEANIHLAREGNLSDLGFNSFC